MAIDADLSKPFLMAFRAGVRPGGGPTLHRNAGGGLAALPPQHPLRG